MGSFAAGPFSPCAPLGRAGHDMAQPVGPAIADMRLSENIDSRGQHRERDHGAAVAPCACPSSRRISL